MFDKICIDNCTNYWPFLCILATIRMKVSSALHLQVYFFMLGQMHGITQKS
jgi:hypothetical protein